MGQVVPDRGDVDEHAALHVNPSRINLVECIGLLAIYIMRVDLEQIISTSLVSGRLVVIRRHIVIGGKKIHAGFGDLTAKKNDVSWASIRPKVPLVTEDSKAEGVIISFHNVAVKTNAWFEP